MSLSCARCGLKQEDIPATTITPPATEENPDPEPIEVHRFELYDAQRDLYICVGCFEMYNQLLPLATDYSMVVEQPELRADVLSRVPNPEFGFFKQLLPGQVF